MIFGLHVLAGAEDDVDAVAAYIASHSSERAIDFCDAIESTYELIREDPICWPLYDSDHPRVPELRKRSVLGFPKYLVFYRVDADMVYIVRVLHGARDIPAILADMFDE